MGWEAVIGLEVHAQLLTRSKLFCACSTAFGAAPNTHVCPVCLGLPGALPVLNGEAVRMAIVAALALSCEVRAQSRFARKNYFYPDLPKGYQISQYDEPLAVRGHLVAGGRRIGITRVHMEEDAGKNVHGRGASVVDLNRAGTPLVEIVGEPDLRSAAEAAEYLRTLRDVLVFLGVNDGNLEEGSLRCDANVSIRPEGETKLGTRVELKNINSFRFVERAIDGEIARQAALLESGSGRVEQETRGWREQDGTTFSLRGKEEAHDYRYFPDPDLPPLVVDDALVDRVRASMPELPGAKRERFVSEMGLTPQAAQVLTGHPRVAALFEEAATLHGGATRVANFVQSEVLRDVETHGLGARIPVSARQIASLLKLVDSGAISGKQAKEVYAKIRGTDRAPEEVVADLGMKQVTDVGAIEEVCKRVIADNPKQSDQLKAGKASLMGFFVGQVMKQTGGAANPKMVNDVIRKLLGLAVAVLALSATAACGLSRSGLAGAVAGGDDGGGNAPDGASDSAPPPCDGVDASCLGALAAGWQPVGVSDAGCGSGFQAQALLVNPRVEDGGCMCGACEPVGSYSCDASVAIRGGDTCSDDPAVAYATSGVCAKVPKTQHVEAYAGNATGTVGCFAPNDAGAGATADLMTLCVPGCTIDFCNTTPRCILAEGSVPCPSGFTLFAHPGTGANPGCEPCPCQADPPGACAGTVTVFDDTACSGASSTYATSTCNQYGGKYQSVLLQMTTPPATCAPSIATPGRGDAGLLGVKTICCQ